MKILFNLASFSNSINFLSANEVGVAEAMLTKVCLDNGLPVKPGFYDRHLSFQHSAVYELVKNYAEEKLFRIPTPDYANLVSLGNLQFQLTLHTQG